MTPNELIENFARFERTHLCPVSKIYLGHSQYYGLLKDPFIDRWLTGVRGGQQFFNGIPIFRVLADDHFNLD